MQTIKLPKIECRACNGTGKVDNVGIIGPTLQAERVKSGVKATALARVLNIAKSTLWDLEQNRRGVWTDDLIRAYRSGLEKLSREKALASLAKLKAHADKVAARAKAKKDKAETKRWHKASKATIAREAKVRAKLRPAKKAAKQKK